jgi:hypothetical protein
VNQRAVDTALGRLESSAHPDPVSTFAAPVLTAVMSEVIGIEQVRLLDAVRTLISGADPRTAQAREAADQQQEPDPGGTSTPVMPTDRMWPTS